MTARSENHSSFQTDLYDGKFDTNKMFDALGDAESAIKIHKNAKLRLTNSKRRKEEIRKYRELGYKRWAKETKYGRWLAAEVYSLR